jgi:two-component system, chemotaxis family, protein-glutamate methylesterase/glutaminase
MQSIKQHGGVTIVQAPLEAKSGTMPKEAIKLQTPDLIQGLTEIKNMLLRLGDMHAVQ